MSFEMDQNLLTFYRTPEKKAFQIIGEEIFAILDEIFSYLFLKTEVWTKVRKRQKSFQKENQSFVPTNPEDIHE